MTISGVEMYVIMESFIAVDGEHLPRLETLSFSEELGVFVGCVFFCSSVLCEVMCVCECV